MLVLDRPDIYQRLMVEIRSRAPRLPITAPDMERLGVRPVEQSRVLVIDRDGELRPEHLRPLLDPLSESMHSDTRSGSHAVDIFCKPGVTDAEGLMAARAIELAGGSVTGCRSGVRIRFAQVVALETREAVERVAGNPLIHAFSWHDEDGLPFTPGATDSDSVKFATADGIEMRDCDDDGLMLLSREHGLALDLTEMRAIADHFEAQSRPPTDVELQSIASTWSEHCSHKTFKAPIRFECDDQVECIDGLLRTFLIDPSRRLQRDWVRSSFDDNAGVIAFDDDHDLAFKVETHNHPTALEPYGGAHTGVGGVIRDILAVSAEPVANTDVLCFGLLDLPESSVPAGVFHPSRVARDVVRGVGDYGNNMGIPTVGGAILYHPGYVANPLVFCGTLGIAPRGSHPRQPETGNAIVLLGGRTGRDGLHGATMSSGTLERESTSSSTVQIGAPITEKALRDVLPLLRDEHLYHAINDCGAGGVCSAVAEMGEQLGIEVDLDRVPLKYQGLQPWEIWLSEAQERMILAVDDQSLPRLRTLCDRHEVEVSVIGSFRSDGRMVLRSESATVADLDMRFLHRGRPSPTLLATWKLEQPKPFFAGDADHAAISLLALLAHPNIASKEQVIRQFDQEVGGATVLKPLTAAGGPSDAAVLQAVSGSWRGAVLAHGINPLYGSDPYAMAMLGVDEALRNFAAVGGSIDHVALLDNFCWGDVDEPDGLGGLVRAAQGCRDAIEQYQVPFVCGKDSLRNSSFDGSDRHSIPGTLLISAVGVLPDLRRSVTMDLKRAGSAVYVLGTTLDELGGSHYLLTQARAGGQIPRVRPQESRPVMEALFTAISAELVLSCHDLSEGGLAVAAAEMSLAGELGMDLDVARLPAGTGAVEALLFSESAGRFMVEVGLDDAVRFENLFTGLPCARIGTTEPDARFIVRRHAETLIDVPVKDLSRAWRTPPGESNGANESNLEQRGSQGSAVATGVGTSESSAWAELHDFGARFPGAPAVTSAPRVLVLSAPGINCDRETAAACEAAGADAHLIHLSSLIDGEVRLRDFGMLILPGGFSYGDHLGSGSMLAGLLRHYLWDDLFDFVAGGRPVLGICNGFQALCRLGLLDQVSLVPNESERFECRWVGLTVFPSPCLFLAGIEKIELPVAHGEGRVFVPPDDLEEVQRHAPLRYLDDPNGSESGIAGVCSTQGNVFGMMPHPERYTAPHHHPRRRTHQPTGLAIFANAVRYLRERA